MFSQPVAKINDELYFVNGMRKFKKIQFLRHSKYNFKRFSVVAHAHPSFGFSSFSFNSHCLTLFSVVTSTGLSLQELRRAAGQPAHPDRMGALVSKEVTRFVGLNYTNIGVIQ